MRVCKTIYWDSNPFEKNASVLRNSNRSIKSKFPTSNESGVGPVPFPSISLVIMSMAPSRGIHTVCGEIAVLKKRKQPYWIRMQDEQPFLMAGLWECWLDKSVENPESLETFTILTTESNSLTMEVHDRMPVILRSNDYDRWLDPELTDADELSFLFEPFDPNEMQLDPVNDRVNSVRNDDEECILIEPELF